MSRNVLLRWSILLGSISVSRVVRNDASSGSKSGDQVQQALSHGMREGRLGPSPGDNTTHFAPRLVLNRPIVACQPAISGQLATFANEKRFAGVVNRELAKNPCFCRVFCFTREGRREPFYHRVDLARFSDLSERPRSPV